MEHEENLIIKDPSEKTAIHQRCLSAVPIDMIELINKLDAEHENLTQKSESE